MKLRRFDLLYSGIPLWFVLFVAWGAVFHPPNAEAGIAAIENGVIRVLKRLGILNSAGVYTVADTVTSTDTTGDAFTIVANSLTTGSALRITSTSADTGTRDMFELRDDSGGVATGTSLANWFTQSNTTAFTIDHNGGGSASIGIFLDHAGAGAALKAVQSLSSGGPISCITASSTNSGAGEAFAFESTAGRNRFAGGTQLERYLEISTVDSSTPNVLTAAESWSVFSNEGTSDVNYHALPTAAAGLTFCFYVQDATGLRVTANTGDTITLNGAVSASAGYIESTDANAWVCVDAINATQWMARSAGNWSSDGVPATSLYGEYYFSTPAETTMSAATPVKASGTTTAGDTNGFTHTTNRLTYNGLATKVFSVDCDISISKESGSTTEMVLSIAKDGTVIADSEIKRDVSGTTIGALGTHALVTFATDSYIEIWLESDTGNNLTIQAGLISVTASSRN